MLHKIMIYRRVSKFFKILCKQWAILLPRSKALQNVDNVCIFQWHVVKVYLHSIPSWSTVCIKEQ